VKPHDILGHLARIGKPIYHAFCKVGEALDAYVVLVHRSLPGNGMLCETCKTRRHFSHSITSLNTLEVYRKYARGEITPDEYSRSTAKDETHSVYVCVCGRFDETGKRLDSGPAPGRRA
jgi:hypothetical protein